MNRAAVAALAAMAALSSAVCVRAGAASDWPNTHSIPGGPPEIRKVQEEYVRDALGLKCSLVNGGIVVQGVAQGSAGARAGFREGDRVLGWRSPTHPEELHELNEVRLIGGVVSALVLERPWAHATFEVSRGAQRLHVHIPLEGLKQAEDVPWRNEPFDHAMSRFSYETFRGEVALARSLLGITSADDETRNCFVQDLPAVKAVLDGGPASAAGLRPGDVLVRFEKLYLPAFGQYRESSRFNEGLRSVGRMLAPLSKEPSLWPECRHCPWRTVAPWDKALTVTIRYLREGTLIAWTLPLKPSLPLHVEHVPGPHEAPIFARRPGDPHLRPRSSEAKGLVARLRVLRRAELDGEVSRDRLKQDAAALVGDAGAFLARAPQDAHAGDPVSARRVIFLCHAWWLGDWREPLGGLVEELSRRTGPGPMQRTVASEILSCAGPASTWRVARATEAPLSADVRDLVERFRRYCGQCRETKDILQARRCWHEAIDILARGIRLLRALETNSGRAAQLDWLAAHQVSTCVKHDAKRGPAIPRAAPVERHDKTKDEALPAPADMALHAVTRAAELAAAAKQQADPRLYYAATALFASRHPLNWGLVRAALQSAHRSLALTGGDKGAVEMAALATRAALLQKDLPQRELDRLGQLIDSKALDPATRDALLHCQIEALRHRDGMPDRDQRLKKAIDRIHSPELKGLFTTR